MLLCMSFDTFMVWMYYKTLLKQELFQHLINSILPFKNNNSGNFKFQGANEYTESVMVYLVINIKILLKRCNQ